MFKFNKSNIKKLFGAGGLFGKKPTQQKQTVDSGRSISRGQVIEVLCSGGKYGIQGLLASDGNLKKAVYLDDTPIITEQNIENFKGIEIYQRRGTPFQTPIEEFNSEIVSEESVSVEVKFGNPVTRTFVNENCTAIRVRLSFVLNQNKKKDGQVIDVIASSIQFKIFIKEGTNGAFVERGNIEVKGKYSEPYEKIWFYTVDATKDEFSIRIERLTSADSEDYKRVIRWESYSNITESILPFKQMAYVGLGFNAEDFGTSLPERKYSIGGEFLDIPTNSTIQLDGGLVFSNNWDGFFKSELTQPCADVSWIIWRLLTDEIDGTGDEIKPYMIDRYSLYPISKYNNELIPDGYGGFERRFLFNGLINKPQDAWKLIDNILSSCNARRVWENGILKFIQDSPAPIYTAFTNSDVVDGTFTYSGIDITEQATAVQITWTEPQTGKTRQEFFSDAQLIRQFGYRLKQIEAVGCTRRSQAIRLGRAVVYSENYENEQVTFKSRTYGAFVPVGKVIAISDTYRFNKKLGGIVRPASTATLVKLDAQIQINNLAGFDENFYLLLYPDIREAIRQGVFTNAFAHYQQYGISEGRKPNGYLLMCLLSNAQIEIRYISNQPGLYSELTVDVPFSEIPAPNSTYIVVSPEIPVMLYRVEAKEIDNDDKDVVTLTCKQYAPYKWDKIERGFNLGSSVAVSQSVVSSVNPPSNLARYFFYSSTDSTYTINLSWRVSTLDNGNTNTFVNQYKVSYKVNDSDWLYEFTTMSPNYSIKTNQQGLYYFRVQALTINGLVSEWSVTDKALCLSASNWVMQHNNAQVSASVFGV